MVDRREHGANQERDQDCGHESANRRADDLAAEAMGKASAKKNSAAAGNSQIEWGHYSAEFEHASAFFL
jgi:protein subunit release factor B